MDLRQYPVSKHAFCVLLALMTLSCIDEENGDPGTSGPDRTAAAGSNTFGYWDCGAPGNIIEAFLIWSAGGCIFIEFNAPPDNPDLVPQHIVDSWGPGYDYEIEPNNRFDEATPLHVSLDAGQGCTSDGRCFARRRVIGTVNEQNDLRDIAVVTVEYEEDYGVYLCRGTGDCLEFLNTDQAYIEVYDQNKVLLRTTHTHAGSSHNAGMRLTPGIAYFIAVVANRTSGADFQYQLVITD